MSTRFPSSITEERLKYGMKLCFNFILRSKENYENIQRIYKNHIDLVGKYGDDPWHDLEVISSILFGLILRRVCPISIRGFPNDVFITCDDPIITLRLGFGTAYFLTIDRRHILCLGYYIGEIYLEPIEYYISRVEIIPETINEILRAQAETFYVI